MVVSKIVVLVGHEGDLDTQELRCVVEEAVGQALENSRRSAVFEVREGGTHEVTLASIVGSLEDGHPLEHATSGEPEPSTPVVVPIR